MSKDYELAFTTRLDAWLVISEAEVLTRKDAGDTRYHLLVGLGRIMCGTLSWLRDGQALTVEKTHGYPAVYIM